MKAVDTGLKVLSWLFTFESGSTSSPDQVNWPRLQGRVEQSVENMNAEPIADRQYREICDAEKRGRT